jgi:preprotein translocase subunit SecA
MFSLFNKLLNYNEREITKLRKTLEEINKFEDTTRNLKDEEFKEETLKLKQQIQSGEKTLDGVLPWSYALVREASRRVLGQRHFDVQMMGAMALHNGKIAEQKTGEGKTLTATAALYLNALTGKGVHLVTVNDYLARRDSGWMGSVFHFLGMTTSAIISDQSFIYDAEYKEEKANDSRLIHLKPTNRKEAYLADVTYGINSEFGFDYLRDNMVQSPDQRVQRNFFYAIVDEADSVLIDEARTPHIISAPYDEDTSKYYDYAKIVKQLDPETDFIIDEKLRTTHLTEAGIGKVEQLLGVSNIYEKDFETLFHIEACLKAVALFKNDKDYIVRDGEVIIVDEFTGRLLSGRRFSEGLHQAIEAKENVAIKQESKTLATVSLQNYFRSYEKLAGMTGTAITEAEEFHKIYNTDVLVIPTHRNTTRKDHPDMIYKTVKAKYNAVVDAIAEQHKAGRPVLVGTTSIDKNEYVSQLLHKKGVPHELLNAKNHEQEAQIIARAGEKGAVTVATNMAGRGVDIILGGEPPAPDDKEGMLKWQKKHDEVVASGGLYVLGTERHESRRIDNQLRGRAGRQGDPGDTVFFVSLEDDLMRIFGGEQIAKLMNFLNFPEDQPLSHGMVSKAIEQSQVKVEGFNFDIRKHLVEFDDVLNKQRDIVYTLRQKMLMLPHEDAAIFKETVFTILNQEIASMSASFYALKDTATEEDMQAFAKDLELMLKVKAEQIAKHLDEGQEAFEEFLLKSAEKEFDRKEKQVGEHTWAHVISSIFLSTIDQFWTQHLTAIEDLREGINLRGYAQLDPLVEYKNEAYKLFEQLINDMNYESVRRMMRVEIDQAQEVIQEQKAKEEEKPMILQSASSLNPFTSPEQQQEEKKQELKDLQDASKPKVGRNDPCWCGSGKKYKKCHWPN